MTPREPGWIKHNGSPVCPVPKGHDVEIRWGDGTTERRIEEASPSVWRDWPNQLHLCIVAYRDWTVFKERQMLDAIADGRTLSEAMWRDWLDPTSIEDKIKWLRDRGMITETETVDPLRQMITKTLLPHFDEEDVGAVVDDLMAGLAELQQDCRQVAKV